MIIHGDDDQICELRGSRMLYEKSPSTDKNLKVFPGALHNLYHEIAEVREEAFGDTVQWICQHIPNQNEWNSTQSDWNRNFNIWLESFSVSEEKYMYLKKWLSISNIRFYLFQRNSVVGDVAYLYILLKLTFQHFKN